MIEKSLITFTPLTLPATGNKDLWGKLFSTGLVEFSPSSLAISLVKTNIK
jgi:hypothetical protein